MPRFLYVFGYETPEQRRRNNEFGWDDEDSASLVIDAADQNVALEWGRTVAEEYVRRLFQPEVVSWRDWGYGDRIEPLSENGVPGLDRLVVVREGEFPDWETFPGS